MPEPRPHFDSPEAMNWSMIAWAPLAKSPNWASQQISMCGRVERVAVVEAEDGGLGEHAVVDAELGLLAGSRGRCSG